MSSHDTKNPTGGVNMGHVMGPPDPHVQLLERIISRKNMQRAWKRVKANKGARGFMRFPLRSSLVLVSTGKRSVNRFWQIPINPRWFGV